MTPSNSLWARSWNRLFGTPAAGARRRGARPRSTNRRHRGFESLERREVYSVSFGSALDIGGATSDAVFDVAVDAAGNSYATGYFSGTVDFDLTHALSGDADIQTARGSQDAFVAKYAPDDSLLWVRRMGGDHTDPGLVTDACRDVTVDAAGNVYVAGEFHATGDFGGTNLTSAGGKDGFVTKLSASGNFMWSKRWGTAEDDRSFGGDVDAQGNMYALSLQGDGGYEIVKFTAAGTQSWTRSLTGTSSMSPELEVSAVGSVFVAGAFDGTVDFDPSAKTKYVSSGPSRAAFVLNLDTAGKFKWVTPFVGRTVNSVNGYASASSITLDPSGNIIVGGQYSNTVDFNHGSAVTTLDPVGGAFIAKLNASGGLVWARALANAGSTSGPTTYGLATDAAGNIYASGTFFGSVDLDPGAGADVRTTVGSTDVFVAKLTAGGNYVWGETFGGVGSDSSLGIAVDSAGDVHVAIFYADQVDFDPSPLAAYTLGSPGAARNGVRLRLRQA